MKTQFVFSYEQVMKRMDDIMRRLYDRKISWEERANLEKEYIGLLATHIYSQSLHTIGHYRRIFGKYLVDFA